MNRLKGAQAGKGNQLKGRAKIIQVGKDGSLDYSGSSEGDKQQLDLGYILKAQLPGCAEGQDVGIAESKVSKTLWDSGQGTCNGNGVSNR